MSVPTPPPPPPPQLLCLSCGYHPVDFDLPQKKPILCRACYYRGQSRAPPRLILRDPGVWDPHMAPEPAFLDLADLMTIVPVEKRETAANALMDIRGAFAAQRK
jgi:hypothetical protein